MFLEIFQAKKMGLSDTVFDQKGIMAFYRLERDFNL